MKKNAVKGMASAVLILIAVTMMVSCASTSKAAEEAQDFEIVAHTAEPVVNTVTAEASEGVDPARTVTVRVEPVENPGTPFMKLATAGTADGGWSFLSDEGIPAGQQARWRLKPQQPLEIASVRVVPGKGDVILDFLI